MRAVSQRVIQVIKEQPVQRLLDYTWCNTLIALFSLMPPLQSLPEGMMMMFHQSWLAALMQALYASGTLKIFGTANPVQKIEAFRIQIFLNHLHSSLITIMFHKLGPTLLALLLLLGLAAGCAQGQLSLGNSCSRVSFIEGCLDYGPNQCNTCEYNYDLTSGRCDYNPQPVEKCCIEFGSNGECSKCQPGLFLDNGACKQVTIVGCLNKDGSKCTNCADGYFLNNNRCTVGVKKCSTYSANGSCLACATGHALSEGLCVPSSILNCASEYSGKCSKCQVPYTLSDGQCKIDNCLKSGEFGCIECSPNFYSTQDGLCAPYDKGCRTYRHGACVSCLPNFALTNGVCKMNGCATQGSGNTCKVCASGYELSSDGVCKIPYCLKSSQDKCLICSSGYHLTGGKCKPIASNCVDFVGYVCRTCAPGYFLGADGKCALQQPGCSKYSQGLCVECTSPFTISPAGKCLIDGCDKFDSSGCLTCKSPYTILGKICKLPNCEQSSNGLCTVCSKGYHLYNKQCTADDPYCVGYNTSGKCSGCFSNFHITDANTCVVNMPGCVYTGSSCSSCAFPFTFVNGACKIDYCKTYNNQGCVECEKNYFLSLSSICVLKEIGGIYTGGVLTGCSAPFNFNPSAKKCEIEGCTALTDQGCTSCASPYKLTQNICKIDNCAKTSNGQCVQCESGFKVLNGLCNRSIDNCVQYNANGCQTCASPFYVSASGDSCLPVQAGCIYSNGQCVKCADPFTFNNGACTIEGCSDFDTTGCKTCKVGYTLDSGKCTLPNCKTIGNGACSTCDDGFQLSAGVCKASDKCVELNTNGTCKRCSTGYSTNICGRCVPTVSNCAFYGRDGKCSECISMYFLTKDFSCQLRDKGCKSYANGVCQECEANYFLYNGICFPYTEGCLKYQGKDCISCATGYTLSQGICLKTLSKLTKGLNFDDDFAVTVSVPNITNTSDGKDIDFNSVSAKNPASGATVGTLFYSSAYNSNYNTYGINSTVGWKAAKAVAGQWAGMQLSSAQTFYEFNIQAGENGAFVSEFVIEFSVDGIKFDQVPGVFTADCSSDKNKIVKVQFVPVYAIAIRFVVNKFKMWPAARFDFIYNNIDQKQDWAGLFSTNQINKKIYAIQSSRLSNQLDINIRRFFNPVRDCSDKEKCWSGIQLCEPKNVTAISFPTTTNTTGAITEFYIDYSLDGNYFSCYQNCSAIPVSGSKYSFKSALKAKNVRVHPTKWSGAPEVQFTFDYN